MNERFAMNKEQLELHLDAALRPCPPIHRRNRRLGRARWWFDQMRATVDRAFDWKSAPPARPEQVYFTLARGR